MSEEQAAYFVNPEEYIARIVGTMRGWYVLEYEDARGHLQRRVLPARHVPAALLQGPAPLPAKLLRAGIEYSDVDLPGVLGETLALVIRTRDLQDALRRAGLWRKADYARHPERVRAVYMRLIGLDVTRLLNAAQAAPEEGE